MNFLSQIRSKLLDILFPVFCLGCQKEGEVICSSCFKEIEVFTKPYCPVCRFRLADNLNNEQHKNCRNKSNLKILIAATLYDNQLAKTLIENYKYQFIKLLSQPLANLIIKTLLVLDKDNLYNNKDLVITSVPLHRKRLQWRGFNQSELIAYEISQKFGWEYLDILTRLKDTKPQIQLNFEERDENIKDSFRVKNGINLNGKTVLLVDDVYTSGATMNECAKILKNARAKEVWGVVIAK